MRMFTLASLVAVGLGLALVVRGPAYARTPAPTAAPTLTSTPTTTPTPPPELVARFNGAAWVDARPSPDDITAKIGDVVCGTAKQRLMADAPNHFDLAVVSDALKSGCGREGATITFFVGDRRAQTAVWHAGTDTDVDLIAGPPFAYVGGRVTWNCPLNARLLPFVGDLACGYPDPVEYLPPPCSDNTVGYSVVVYSQEQKPGCGTEGVEITFKLVDFSGSVIAIAAEKGAWYAWGGTNEVQRLDLTMVPVGGAGITVGSVGTGDGPERATAPWGPLALALASLGLTGGIAALAFRRRAM